MARFSATTGEGRIVINNSYSEMMCFQSVASVLIAFA
jgi:hypothetical protein